MEFPPNVKNTSERVLEIFILNTHSKVFFYFNTNPVNRFYQRTYNTVTSFLLSLLKYIHPSCK